LTAALRRPFAGWEAILEAIFAIGVRGLAELLTDLEAAFLDTPAFRAALRTRSASQPAICSRERRSLEIVISSLRAESHAVARD
jgi:hypothetical protein